jgi:hypothetical protein
MCDRLAPPFCAAGSGAAIALALTDSRCSPSRFCDKRFPKTRTKSLPWRSGQTHFRLEPKKQRCRHAGQRLRKSIEHVTSADFLSPKQKRDILYKFLRFDLRTLTVE